VGDTDPERAKHIRTQTPGSVPATPNHIQQLSVLYILSLAEQSDGQRPSAAAAMSLYCRRFGVCNASDIIWNVFMSVT